MSRLIAATSTFEGPAIQWFKISPILALLGGALLLILVGSLTPQWKRGWYATASVVTATTAAVLTAVLWNQIGDDKPSTLVGGAISFDQFALFATFTICVAVALVSLVANDYLVRESEDGPEIYGLMLTAAIGGVVMASANDLLVLFLGLETLTFRFTCSPRAIVDVCKAAKQVSNTSSLAALHLHSSYMELRSCLVHRAPPTCNRWQRFFQLK